MEQPRDEKLWRIARKRTEFRKSVYAYILVIGFLWAIWWFTIGRSGNFDFPWPIWVMLGWGIGLIGQYWNAYHGDEEDRVEKEYERLKRKHQL